MSRDRAEEATAKDFPRMGGFVRSGRPRRVEPHLFANESSTSVGRKSGAPRSCLTWQPTSARRCRYHSSSYAIPKMSSRDSFSNSSGWPLER